MPNQILPQRWSEVCQNLGFGSRAADFEQWLSSELFKPFWLRLYSSITGPNQGRAEAINLLSVSFDVFRVKHRLLEAQTDRRSKYSHPLPDTSAWDRLDHLAFFLYHTVLINKDHREGVFYQKNIREKEMQHNIWQVLESMVIDHSPLWSLDSFGATLMGTRNHDAEAQRLQTAVTGMTMPGPRPQNLWGGVICMSWNPSWSDPVDPEKSLEPPSVFKNVQSFAHFSSLRNKVRLEYDLLQLGKQVDTIIVHHQESMGVLSPATWEHWRDVAARSIGPLKMEFTTRELMDGEDYMVSFPHLELS